MENEPPLPWKPKCISDVELLRGIGAGCDKEAIRVIANAPAWKSGKQNSRPIRVKMRLPIRFKLQCINKAVLSYSP